MNVDINGLAPFSDIAVGDAFELGNVLYIKAVLSDASEIAIRLDNGQEDINVLPATVVSWRPGAICVGLPSPIFHV